MQVALVVGHLAVDNVTGAVRLHKTEGVEQQQVSETVRKEDVEVVRDGKTVTETSEVHQS